jgi:hypothetical protein
MDNSRIVALHNAIHQQLQNCIEFVRRSDETVETASKRTIGLAAAFLRRDISDALKALIGEAKDTAEERAAK